MLTSSSPSGVEFARFADQADGRWLLLAGLTVTHKTYGEGVVVQVNERHQAPPLFQISFSDSQTRTFNPDGFRRDVFAAVRLSDEIETQYANWRESDRKQRQQADAAAALAERYGVTQKSTQQISILLPVLTKLDIGYELETSEIAWMEEECLYRPLATYFYRRYRRLTDPWELARACKYLRKAALPRKALEVIDSHLKGSNAWPAAAHSAILTSRGGAFRDIGDFQSGKTNALQAVQLSPKSPHPHNLLGALYLTEGLIAEGERHFDMAAELGGNESHRDREYHTIMTSTTDNVRHQIADYLLSKDPKKYSWASTFARRPEP
jgi:hypothetical protein